MNLRRPQPIRVLAVLGLTAIVSGCGNDGTTATTAAPTTAPTSAPSTVAPTTAPSTTTGTSEQLTTLLLAADDIGPTWKLGSPINEADLRDLAAQIAEPCPGTALNPTIAARLAPHDAVQFEPSDGSPMLIMESIVAGEPEQLSRDLTAFLTALTACIDGGAFTPEPSDSVPVAVKYTALTFPEMGEQSFAWMATTTEPQIGNWYGRTALVRWSSP